MAKTIGGIEVRFAEANRDFKNWWVDYEPSQRLLPKGWQKDPETLPLREDLIWDKDVDIPLRDGVKLRADVFRPVCDEHDKIPALIAWSPYGKTGSGRSPDLGRLVLNRSDKAYGGSILGEIRTVDFAHLGLPKESLSGLEKFEAPDPADWCPRGYAIVQPDARGCFNSEGDIVFYGTQEGRDGYDTVEWVAAQPWCNGNVGLAGNSWLATTQWLIAAEQPPHLKAIAPWEGLGDYYRESICRGGIPATNFWSFLSATFNGHGAREDVTRMIEEYPLINGYWEDKKPRIQKIKIPMYALASYSTGLHTEGSIRGWKYSNSEHKWLRIHATQEWFDIYQPEWIDDLQRFFDHFLKSKENGWENTPKVRVSLLRYNRPPISFRVEDDYPPKRTKYETLFLDASKGALSTTSPTSTSVASYQSDSWDDDGAHFTYTFAKYTELCGFSKAKLYMSCADLDDLDVYVIIRKLDRDGKPLLSCNIPFINQKPGTKPEDIPDLNIYKYVGPNGRLRASKRRVGDDPDLTPAMKARRDPTEVWYPHNESQKVPPGDIVELEIGIWPGGIAFEKGETLRFEIKGHDPILPEFAPLYRQFKNLNHGTHQVHTGGKYPSSIMLPLLF